MTDRPVLRAFSADHVVRLTGLSIGQLRYWNRIGFFVPQHLNEGGRAFNLIYSFRDVVGLKALSILRNQHRISLQYLQGKVAAELVKFSENPWSDIKLYVWGREVVFREPDSQKLREVVSKQYVEIPIAGVATDIEAEARRLKERTPDQLGSISRKKHIAGNAFVIAGTRIPTSTIYDYRRAGRSDAEILSDFPSLTPADIEAAVRHERKSPAAA